MVEDVTEKFMTHFSQKFMVNFLEDAMNQVEEEEKKGKDPKRVRFSLNYSLKSKDIWIEYYMAQKETNSKDVLIKVTLCLVSDTPMPNEFLDRYSELNKLNAEGKEKE